MTRVRMIRRWIQRFIAHPRPMNTRGGSQPTIQANPLPPPAMPKVRREMVAAAPARTGVRARMTHDAQEAS